MMSPFWQHHNQMIIAVVKYNVFIYIYSMLSKREKPQHNYYNQRKWQRTLANDTAELLPDTDSVAKQ